MKRGLLAAGVALLLCGSLFAQSELPAIISDKPISDNFDYLYEQILRLRNTSATTSNALHIDTLFSGDVSGTYNTMAVGDDSHSHSDSTLTGLAASKLTGALPALDGSALTGVVHTTATLEAILAAVQAAISTAAYTTESYANPAWITSLAGAKITGVLFSTSPIPTGLIDLSTVTANHVLKSSDTMTGPLSINASIAGTSPTLSIFNASGASAYSRYYNSAGQVSLGVDNAGLFQVSNAGDLGSGGMLTINFADQRVGIRAGNPQYTLHVGGNIFAATSIHAFDGFYGAATGLTSVPAAQLVGQVPTVSVDLSTVTTALSGKLSNTDTVPTYLVDLSTIPAAISTALSPVNAALSTAVYTTETYYNPAFITSLESSKIDFSTITTALDGKVDDTGDTIVGQLNINNIGTALAVLGNTTLTANGGTEPLIIDGGALDWSLTQGREGIVHACTGTGCETISGFALQSDNQKITLRPLGATALTLNTDGGAVFVSSVTAYRFEGSGAGLTDIPGDNLGSHVATMTITGNYGASISTLVVSGSQFSVGGSTLVVAGGNVGAGSSPIAKFSSVGDYAAFSGTGRRNAVFADTSAAGRGVWLGHDTSGAIGILAAAGAEGSLAFWTNNSGSWSEKVRISSTGAMGIGTTAPQLPLSVVGNSSFTGTGYFGGQLDLKQNNALGYKSAAGAALGGVLTLYGDELFINDPINSASSNIIFRNTGATERMRITAAGHLNVIAGLTASSVTARTSGAYQARFERSGGSAPTTGKTDILHSNFGYSGGTGADTIVASDWGIGFQVNVQGTPSYPFLVTNGGNVGIGTTAPVAKLEVAGQMYQNSAGTKMLFKSPDGTCSACGPDDSDAWACASVSCP